MTTTTSVNGRTRRTLAERLDRLDDILNRLTEDPNEAMTTAVAAAVKGEMTTAVQEAVHAAALEVLANKELQQRQGMMHTPASQPPLPVGVRLTETTRRCWTWLAGVARDTWDTVTAAAEVVKDRTLEAANHLLAVGRAKVQPVRDHMTACVRAGWMRLVVLATLAGRLRRRLLVALGVGVAAGLVAYLAGPLVVPVVCGLAGFVVSLLASVWVPSQQRPTTPEAGGN
jgi:hypothetical protein